MKKPIWFITPKRLNLHKVLKSYLPAHSVDLSSQRPIDIILNHPILQNPLNQNEEPNLI